jgi:DNA-binding protein HU-beta
MRDGRGRGVDLSIDTAGVRRSNYAEGSIRALAWSRVRGAVRRLLHETGRSDFDKKFSSNEGLFVNKTELIEHIASQADISKAAATRALDAMVGAVKTTLKKGGSVSLVGFGTFAVSKRAARSGRNPRTGATIKIKAAKVPKFRPGKALKDAVN